MRKKDNINVGLVVRNTGHGVGIRSEARGVGTTGLKIIVGAEPRKEQGVFGDIWSLLRKLARKVTSRL